MKPAWINEDCDSLCSISMLSGPSVTLWSDGVSSDTCSESRLRLSPERPAIIGRAQGSRVPYLDPAYQATTMLPGSGQSVLRNGGEGADISVSRGHFMLRAARGGVLLINGVPALGGGIRPPLNGTWLLFPVRRLLKPGEEHLIENGAVVILFLPNGAEVEISAA